MANSNALSADILERISDGFVALDSEWRYTYVNQRAGELLGRDPQTLIGKHIWTEFPEGAGQPFHIAYERAMRDQMPLTLEEYYAPWDRWFENRVYPSRGGLSILFTEITERVLARKALQQQALLFEILADAVVLTDAQGRVTGWNPAAGRDYGRAVPGVLGLPSGSAALEALRLADAWTGEVRATRRDGQERLLHARARAIRDPQGRLTGTVTVYRDVTEERRAVQALRDREERLRLAARATRDLMYDWNLRTGTIEWTEAVSSVFGFSAEQVRPTLDWWKEQVHPDDRSRVVANLEDALRGEISFWTAAYRLRRADGSDAEVLERGYIVRDDAGVAVRMIGTITDVSELKRTETELRAAKDRLESFLDTIPDHVWLKDLDGRYLLVNEALASARGLARDRVVGSTDFDLFPAEDARRFVESDAEVLRGERRLTFEHPFHAADGTEHWFEVIKAPVRDGEAIVGTVGIARDITARKRVELALRESEQRFRQIAHNVHEVFWLVELAGSGVRLVYASPAYEEIFGRTLESAYADATSGLAELSPEDREHQSRAMKEAVAGREASSEYLLPHPTRGPRWIRTRYFPVRDEEGRVYRVAGLSEDITERREAEAHYRRLVETAPYGIYATDLQGHITEANPALGEIAGRAPEEMIGRHFAGMIAPEDVGLIQQRLNARREGDVGAHDLEFRVLRPDGTLRLLHVRSTDVQIHGIPAGTHGIVRDITEEREREVHLRRVERLASVGTLIGGVAHELNNPLAAIRSFAELMLLDERAEDDREALVTMCREADRAARIVSNLRQLARDTQTAGDRSREPVDLNDVVRHVLRVRRYALETHNVELREELAASLPPVLADRGEMEQVILNLVVNAEQALATVSGARRLTVRTHAGDQGVVLAVADTGPGIAPDHLQRVFDPFFTTKPPGEGTGLGLSLVHSIVTEHGGEVHVESSSGAGTTFRVELPATTEAAHQSSAPPPPRAAPRPLRVLVVDDEESVRVSLSRFLGRRGHRVDVAREGEEAIRFLRAAGPGAAYDVLLTDLRMPGLGGDALLAQLQRERHLFSGRLVVMTGESVARLAPRVLELSEVPVLYKPFSLDQVARVVENGG